MGVTRPLGLRKSSLGVIFKHSAEGIRWPPAFEVLNMQVQNWIDGNLFYHVYF